MPRDLDPDAILATLLAAGMPYAAVRVEATVDSTNAVLRADPMLWAVVAADEQTGGRGRLGRSWSTPPGRALAVSVLLPTPPDPAWLPLVAGLAVGRAIARTTGLSTTLKWPNDVLLPGDEDRKVCGILCELRPEGVIVGMGLNVHQTRAELPVPTATSLALAGVEVDRGSLLTAYLVELATAYATLVDTPNRVHDDYRAACATIGSSVRVLRPGDVDLIGRATGIDEHGRLELAGPTGPRVVAAGDVVHVRPTQ